MSAKAEVFAYLQKMKQGNTFRYSGFERGLSMQAMHSSFWPLAKIQFKLDDECPSKSIVIPGFHNPTWREILDKYLLALPSNVPVPCQNLNQRGGGRDSQVLYI